MPKWEPKKAKKKKTIKRVKKVPKKKVKKRSKKTKEKYNCIACSDTGKNSKGRNCICVERRR